MEGSMRQELRMMNLLMIRRFYGASVVRLIAGKSEKPFHVHHDLLCDAHSQLHFNLFLSSPTIHLFFLSVKVSIKLILEWEGAMGMAANYLESVSRY